MSGKHILVVDDHRPLAENLAEILEGEGYRPSIAESAEEAIEQCQSGDVAALIITDFKLPGLNGAQLISALRKEGIETPALVVSAYTDEKTIGDAQAAGVETVLPKPVDITKLMAHVQALIPGE